MDATAAQKATLLSSLFLVCFAGFVGKKWWQGPEKIEEQDRERALSDPLREKVQAKRGQMDRSLIEWLERKAREARAKTYLYAKGAKR